MDSYTKVSSESDEFVSLTALATFASKISAFDEAARPRNGISDALERLRGGNCGLGGPESKYGGGLCVSLKLLGSNATWGLSCSNAWL